MTVRRFLAVAAALVAMATVPRAWCGHDAAAWLANDSTPRAQLARTVASASAKTRAETSFETGSARFDGEWLFGTQLMAALGFGHVALTEPANREALGQMDAALDRALEPAARAFDTQAWGQDAFESLEGDGGHAALLGYLNLALALRERLAPGSPHGELSRAISRALGRRLEHAPGMMLETYPGEIYPVDNTAVIASIALSNGQRARPLVRRFVRELRARAIDPETGLLAQSLDQQRQPLDAPRGSGTALAVYFTSFADIALSRDLYRALTRELADSVLGFGVLREYPRGQLGMGDIDSGPLVFGYSISATGFALAGARIHGDSATFERLYRTFHLMGAPLSRRGSLSFVSGGALGNAIVFAMLTAPRAEELPS